MTLDMDVKQPADQRKQRSAKMKASSFSCDDVLQMTIAMTSCSNTEALHRCLVERLAAVFHVPIAVYRGAKNSAELKRLACYGAGCSEEGMPDAMHSLLSKQLELTRFPERVACADELLDQGAVFCLRCKAGFTVSLVICGQLSRDERQYIDHLFHIYINQLGLLWHAMLDSLTGLMNRQTYDEKMTSLYRRHHAGLSRRRRQDRVEADACFAMLDIDLFKHINDSYGHIYGDEVLIAVADMMRQFFRDYDMVFRYGGEEFVVVLMHVDLAKAQAVLERFRAALAKAEFAHVGQVTVSIGFTALRFDKPYREIADCADQALYVSKQQGRNRVTCFEHLPAAGQTAGGKDKLQPVA